MKRIKTLIRSYYPFALNEIKTNMSYRMSFFITILSRGFTILATYYLWKAIYTSSTSSVLNGFNFEEMTGYVIISFLTAIVVSSDTTREIAMEISDGSITMNLIKPINYKRRIYACSIGRFSFRVIFCNIPFLVLFKFLGWIKTPSIMELLFYVLSTCLAFHIMFYFGFCFALLAFYTTYYFGINMTKEVIVKFFSGAMIPISFFPASIGKLIEFFPFTSLNYVPVMIYLKKLTQIEIYQSLCIQLFWAAAFLLLSNVLWKSAIKRLTLLGG